MVGTILRVSLALALATAIPVVAMQQVGNADSAAHNAKGTTPQSGTGASSDTSKVAQAVPAKTGSCQMEVPANVTDVSVPPPAPLSTHCKFRQFLKQTYSPYTFVSAGWQAGWAQAAGQWPQYGGGMSGYGKRFGATLADTEARRFIQGFALSSLLHHDPRYFPSGKRNPILRAWYAGTRVLVGRKDDARHTFNYAEFFGVLFTSSLQNTYYPSRYRTFEDTMGRFAGAITSDAIGDLLREFTPDMKRFFNRHAPPKVKTIERKLPIPAEDKP